jgi:hypothetical protein
MPCRQHGERSHAQYLRSIGVERFKSKNLGSFHDEVVDMNRVRPEILRAIRW